MDKNNEVDYNDDVTPEAIEWLLKYAEEKFGPFNPDEWEVVSGPAW